MLSQWQDLLKRLTVVDEDPELFSAENVADFEKELGFSLPVGYSEFCQVFGTGTFDNYVYIRCLKKSIHEECIEAINMNLEVMFEFIDTYPYAPSLKYFSEHCYVFGASAAAHYFAWDLETYSPIDKSYDIYIIPFQSLTHKKVGRDLLEFVTGFCLGSGSIGYGYDVTEYPIQSFTRQIRW